MNFEAAPSPEDSNEYKISRARKALEALNSKWAMRGMVSIIALLSLDLTNMLVTKDESYARKIVKSGILHVADTAKEMAMDETDQEVVKELRSQIEGREIHGIEFSDFGGVEELETPKVETEGFEKFKVSGLEIQKMVQEALPAGTLRNLESISYKDDFIPMPEVYGQAVGQYEAAHVSWTDRRMVVSKGSQDQSIEWILGEMLPHEVGHLNDWNNPRLAQKDRLHLMIQTLRRVNSPDRFKSSYVEAIQNTDPKVEKTRKCTEYFAEIFSAYLSPITRKLLPAADKKIISEYLKKVDPKFSLKTADAKRGKIIAAAGKTTNKGRS